MSDDLVKRLYEAASWQESMAPFDCSDTSGELREAAARIEFLTGQRDAWRNAYYALADIKEGK